MPCGQENDNQPPEWLHSFEKTFLNLASFLFITSLIFNKMSNLLPFVAILHDFATDLTFLSFSKESISRVRSSVIKRQSASSLPVDLFTFLNSVFNRLFPCRVAFPTYGDQRFRRGLISRLLIFLSGKTFATALSSKLSQNLPQSTVSFGSSPCSNSSKAHLKAIFLLRSITNIQG